LHPALGGDEMNPAHFDAPLIFVRGDGTPVEAEKKLVER
jgi:hypothetical protein